MKVFKMKYSMHFIAAWYYYYYYCYATLNIPFPAKIRSWSE